MNKAIRWRIVSLQAMLVIILAGASGFLFYEGNFVTNMVKDELTAQQVFFPTADQIKAGLAKISKYQGVDGAYTFDPSTHEMFPVDSISFVQYQSNGTYKAVK